MPRQTSFLTLAALDLNEAASKETTEAILGKGGRAEACRCDVTVWEQVQAAVEKARQAFGRLDVLINCAGIIRRAAEHDPAVFAEVVEVNLTGTMRLAAAARPLLAKTAGCIVNTASMFSFFGGPHAPGYAASKGGVADYSGITYEKIEKQMGVFWPCPSDDHPGTPRLFEPGSDNPVTAIYTRMNRATEAA